MLLLLVACTVLVASATAQSHPTVRVAFLHDRPAADWAQGFRDSLRLELGRVLGVDYTVEMPADLEVNADGTRASCRSALEGLLGDRRVDLIIASGPLGSFIASQMSTLERPVIGSWILASEIQQVPLVDGTSGKRNFTYLTMGNLLAADLAALSAVMDFEHLAIVSSSGFLTSLPRDGRGLEGLIDGRISPVIGDGTVASVLAQVPADADAIYLLPMIDMSRSDVERLLTEFRGRKLPVLSLIGEPEVRAGALVGVAPADWQRRANRRVALMAARILAGEEAGSIPVTMMRDGRIFLNVETARRIGVSPPFEVMIEAVLIDTGPPEAAAKLDLFGVMDAAQAQNRDIAAAENAAQAGSKQVNVARSDLLPQLDLEVSGELVDQDNAKYWPSLSEQTLRGGLNLTQLIYADRAWANYTIEKHRQEARVGELDRVRLDVGLEAATAYLGMLITETQLQIQRQNLTYSRTNLERAEIRVAVGDANRSELYRWQSKIAAEQAQVVDAATNRRVAAVELNRVLNRPLEDVLDLEDTTVGDPFETLVDPRVDAFMQDPQSLSILRDFFVQKGLLAAPELQQYDAAIKAQQRAHTAATRSFWVPNLGLTGSLENVFARGGEGSPLAEEVPDDLAWNVGVFLSLPLLEGGGRLAESQRTTLEV
jgi:outer membrane protein TolC